MDWHEWLAWRCSGWLCFDCHEVGWTHSGPRNSAIPFRLKRMNAAHQLRLRVGMVVVGDDGLEPPTSSV